MDAMTAKERLLEVLEGIQQSSGGQPVPITGSTCPLRDLPGFDSKVWPVAITMLSLATGIGISNKTNIFLSADGKERLTVDQIATNLSSLSAQVA